MKRIIILIVITILAIVTVFFTGCGARTSPSLQSAAKLKVVATVYPVYEFAQHVGKDKIEVSMLIPPGAEPHDWEPTPQDLAKIKASRLLLYHGAGLEPLEKLVSPEVIGTVKAVEISKGIDLLQAEGEDEHEHEHEHEQTGSAAHHPVNAEHRHADLHVWLDPVLAQQEVLHIAAALSEADPDNKDFYYTNAENYNKELAKLDQDYQQGLEKTMRRDIVTSHAAFGYLAKRYNLQQVSIMGLSPDSEPTPEQMAKVVTFCRTHNVKYIFFETLVSPKIAETIAKETGAGLLVLNPVESLTGEEMKQGKSYISVMKENLVNLKTALSQ